MKRKTLLTVVCGIFSLVSSAAPNATAMADSGVHGYVPADYVEVTDPSVKANLEHFRDLKLGLMMHFGIYSQVGIDESWPLVDSSSWRARQMTDMGVGDTFKSNYWNLAKTFNPIRFDADAWARVAATNGFKYLCFTTKHHDGFSMYDTKYSDFKITGRDCPYSSRPNADMVRDIWDAFRRRGLAISCYFSKADWHHEDFWENRGIGYETTWYPTYLPKEKPEKWARFEQFLRNQMVELCRDYGRIEIMWLDGASVGCRPDTRVDMDGILAECRKYQPWLIAADRSIKGPNQQLMTPEQTVPAEPMACPWESCITMASNWSYRFDDEYKSAKELIQLFVGIVAKGGCLALNVAPRPDGVIPQPALERMNAMGAWLRKNGEAIYATRPLAPYSSRNWCFTQRDGKRYAIRLTREGERDLRRIVLDGTKFGGVRVTRIVHVPTQREMAFVRVTDGWAFDLPADLEADPYAEVFRFEVSDEAPDVPANVTVRPDPAVAGRLVVSWTTRLAGSSIVRYGAVANDLNVTVRGEPGTNHRVAIPTAGYDKAIYYSVETDGRRSPVQEVSLCVGDGGGASAQEVGCGPHPTTDVLRLGSPFTDGVVLQRDKPVRVWGWADPGATVTVTFGSAAATAVAAADGAWRTELPAFPASKEPRVLAATTSARTVEVRDVLVGEVWLAAGQSNMEFPLWFRGVRLRDRQGALTAQMTNKPHVRYAKMCDYTFSVEPVRERSVVWKPFTSDNLAKDYVPAVGAYFAIELANALDIPIGWIACDWGGTRIEPWIPAEGYAAVPDLADFAARTVVPKFRTTDRAYADGRENQQPGVLWNRQVACLVPFQARGMIWYQGESNRNAATRYRALLEGLYAGWSGQFANPDFRLYLVQIAPHNYVDDVGQLCRLQEAQQAFADANPNAEIAIINDVGDLSEIHPHEKHTVGKRLAAFALANDYGWTHVRPRAPTLKTATVEGARMTLAFRDAEGLYTYDEAVGFELAGADGVWREAKPVGPTGRRGYVFPEGKIVLEAAGVDVPRHVRYLATRPWTGHVFNGSTIPLGTFHYDLPGTEADLEQEVADVYYVDEAGDDANLGTDRFRPMRTLPALVRRIRDLRQAGKLPADKRINVQVLSETFVLEHPLVLTAADSHLRFCGAERPGAIVLRGAAATPDGERPSQTPVPTLVEIRGARDVTFEGLQFEFATEAAVVLESVDGFKFGNCEFNRVSGDALRLANATKGNVVHCVFEEIGRSAVRFAACTNVTVDNCVARRTARTDETASAFTLTASDCTLTHNLVYDTAKGAAVYDTEKGVLPETEPGLYDDRRYWGSGANFWLKIFNP